MFQKIISIDNAISNSLCVVVAAEVVDNEVILF